MKKRLIKGLPFVCILFLLSSCRKETQVLRPYYYPVDELQDGLVYEYRSVGTLQLEPEYWYFRSFFTDTATYLTGQYYNSRFYVEQFFREEYASNGSKMIDYILYEQDSSGQSHPNYTKILAPNGLPFEKPDSSQIFLYKLQWNDRTFPGRTTTLIRNRRFIGFEKWEWQNKKVDCAVFEVREIVETEEEGFQEIQLNGIERYAKGFGLVYYEKQLGDELLLQYSLFDRYPMKILEDKYQASIQKE